MAHRSSIAGRSRSRRRSAAVLKRQLGSKVGNGTALLPRIDHRGAEARRLRALLADFKSDIPRPSTAECLVIGHAAFLELLIEKQKADFVRHGMKVRSITQLLGFLRTVQAQRRLLVTVGLSRRAKEVEDLDSYLQRKYARNRTIEAEDAEIVDQAAELGGST